MKDCLWRPGTVIEAKAPLRVDFCGMTDFIPVNGWCVNATIDLMATLRMTARYDSSVRIEAGSFGVEQYDLSELGRADNMFTRAMELVGYSFEWGVDVSVDCEHGSIGLSSSSSVGAMYIAALRLACGLPFDSLTVAKETRQIEPHWYGRQDQLSVAFGGLNLWHMTPETIVDGRPASFGEVERYPINMMLGKRATLEDKAFLLYNSGIEEGASGILNSVVANYAHDLVVQSVFDQMNELARMCYGILACPRGEELDWLTPLGEAFSLIREEHKRLHPSVTNDRLETLFEAGAKAGALGGRFSGAGGRGALTFICPPGKRATVISALNQVDVPFQADSGKIYTVGRPINFGHFLDFGVRAWFVRSGA